MKRILTLVLLTTMIFVISSMMNPQEAQALLPISCNDWIEGGYSSVVNGWLCIAHLALEEAFPWEDRYSTVIKINPPTDEELYALKVSPAKNQRIWKPLRA